MKRQKLNSRRTAALLASTLVLSQAEPILALADVKVETAAETVTDENAVVITSVDDLVQMSKNCVSESYSKGKTFVLTQDISLDGSDFQPIAVFAGSFQGNGHVISGLNITISGVPLHRSRRSGKRSDRKRQCKTGWQQKADRWNRRNQSWND